MYYTYVLRSTKDRKFYTGFTTDVSKRLEEHNTGKVESTRLRIPFELLYYEAFLGFKIYRKHRLLKGVCLNRYLRKYREKKKQLAKGDINEKAMQHSVTSWQNHIAHGDTYGLKNFLTDKYQISFREEAKHE